MTTEDTLRADREARDVQQRRDDRAAARRTIAGLAARHQLNPAGLAELLDACGLNGDEDDGLGVLLPHAFNQPGTTPPGRVYR
jgi:hypothetical protein